MNMQAERSSIMLAPTPQSMQCSIICHVIVQNTGVLVSSTCLAGFNGKKLGEKQRVTTNMFLKQSSIMTD